VRTVSSVAAVLPPQTGQRKRQQVVSGRELDEPAGWNTTVPRGGQCVARSVPTGRAHSRQAISATITRRCLGRKLEKAEQT